MKLNFLYSFFSYLSNPKLNPALELINEHFLYDPNTSTIRVRHDINPHYFFKSLIEKLEGTEMKDPFLKKGLIGICRSAERNGTARGGFNRVYQKLRMDIRHHPY
jgi:hypothetical protein|tara:strand:- start:597 stop:911 length:315 start_codon:yes stop_codon:yes gene_type:complete